ncbi:VOC family protein [Arthrobacter sp. B0490]|uniref:VOC family protein n=1 Tax=Arthrobacter sp. B0490 TaxID=2058891 RepID=UPI000CE4D9B4|nr:VOC family protein [Arthrobacter sp. B0490]
MSIKTTTHLNFRGTARQALDFYQGVFGGRVVLATYGDLGMPQDDPGHDRIVFGQVENEDGFRVMAYDVPGQDDGGPTPSTGTRRENGTTMTDSAFFQSVRAEDLEEITRYWNGLTDGATIVEPLAASAWTPGFGMLTDRFGVTWILDVEPAHAA